MNSFRAEGGAITAHLVPIAWTPIGAVIGEQRESVRIALSGVVDWADRTFAPEDERAFVAPVRDIELLARVEWSATPPDELDEEAVLNIDDLPEEVAEAFAHAPAPVLQCAVCRRLCVKDEFVWKERQLCAWDYHAQVFGKRGPWREGPYEAHHFETLASCAYVAPQLLSELGVEVALSLDAASEETTKRLVNALLEEERSQPHLAVRTAGDGMRVLREVGKVTP